MWFIGLEETLNKHIGKANLGGADVFINSAEKLEEALDDENAIFPNIILCGEGLKNFPAAEVAQMLRQFVPKGNLVYVTEKEKVDRRLLLKNGFNEVFSLKRDIHLLEELLQKSSENKSIEYEEILVRDLEENTKISFDLYLFFPMNKKFIRMIKSGQILDRELLKKIEKHEVKEAYLAASDLENFYDYYSENLATKLEKQSEMSATEFAKYKENMMRGLFIDLLDTSLSKASFESGNKEFEKINGVVHKLVEKISDINIQENLLSITTRNNNAYNSASNVASLSFIFATLLEEPDPHKLALAGIFHDISYDHHHFSLTPEEIHKMPDDEKNRLLNHPQDSLNLLKERKISVSEYVANAILQHHERYDGKGFPRNISGNKVSRAAQILSIADQFEKLVKLKAGSPRLNPLRALEEIRKSASVDPELLIVLKNKLQL